MTERTRFCSDAVLRGLTMFCAEKVTLALQEVDQAKLFTDRLKMQKTGVKCLFCPFVFYSTGPLMSKHSRRANTCHIHPSWFIATLLKLSSGRNVTMN